MLQGQAFVLKEGVDYRVKVSFRVSRVCVTLCPSPCCCHTLKSLPQEVSAPHESLFPRVPVSQDPSCYLWVCCPKVPATLGCLLRTPHSQGLCLSLGPPLP